MKDSRKMSFRMAIFSLMRNFYSSGSVENLLIAAGFLLKLVIAVPGSFAQAPQPTEGTLIISDDFEN